MSIIFIDSGVDILELGVPFSDPSADGPVIQKASKRAFEKGVTLEDVLEMSGRIREKSQIPIIIFTYYNPVFAMGVQKFCKKALENGADGVLIVDLPFEEAARFSDGIVIGSAFVKIIEENLENQRLPELIKAGLKISGRSPGRCKKTNFLTTDQSGAPQNPVERLVMWQYSLLTMFSA